MQYINTDDQAGNQHWELRDASGQPVAVGSIQESKADEPKQFKIEGGTPPHKPSSSGKVYGKWFTRREEIHGFDDRTFGSTSEYYPQVFNLKWHDLQAKPEPEKTESPSGQLIGVVIQSMVNDAVKAQLAQNMESIVGATIESFQSTLSYYVKKDELDSTLAQLDEDYLKADEHDFVESTDLMDAISEEINSHAFLSEGDELAWDVDDHASSIQDLMQTSLQSEVHSIVHDMVRNRALIVSLNPE